MKCGSITAKMQEQKVASLVTLETQAAEHPIHFPELQTDRCLSVLLCLTFYRLCVLQLETTYGKKIATTVDPVSVWTDAEEYHQQYVAKKRGGW